VVVAYTARAREDEGVVYTPRSVSEPMVRVALAPLVADRARILERRVLDPCVGEGAFLVEIVRVLAEHLGGPDARRRVAERCVFGRDIDPRAVARAIAAVEDFVGAPVPALREHIVVGDALTITGSYDALVANPPYVRQELLANKQALRSFDVFDGVADLYVYFIELAHRVASRFCFVVPNKWLTAAYGRPLRQFLARANSLEGVVDFASGLFENADAFPCILWGTSSGATEPLRAGKAVSTAVDDSLACAPIVDRARWTAAPAAPWHADSGDDAALLDRLRAAFPPLSAVVPDKPSRGVVTGCNDAFVIDAVTRKRLLVQEPAARELIRPFIKGRDIRSWQPGEIDRYILLVDRGTQLDKFPRVRAHLERFRQELEPRPDDHDGPWEGRKPGSYAWYELQDPVGPLAKSRRPRLFYQDIQTSPACCLDPTGELIPDTTVWILPTDDAFVLALLNSPLYAWYAQRRFPPALNGAVRPKLEYMRELPVAMPEKALRAKITSLVHAQLAKPTPRRNDEIAALICDAYGLTAGERRLLRER
jgi:hypothetical protein